MPEINVEVSVDAADKRGELPRIWNYIGYDECNYTYVPEGRDLLAKLGSLGAGPVYVRAHHLFCTGNCHGTPKWGSTNVYLEDDHGAPVYDWTIIDLIFDTILRHRCTPFVELGFMPRDLIDPAHYDPAADDGSMSTYRRIGWACPPRDYHRWYELVHRTVRHCLDRYGDAEVLGWYWELWNEPDISYWRGTLEELEKLYDCTAAAVKAAHPRARVGGPAVTNPIDGRRSAEYLDHFLRHTTSGRNSFTGGSGSPLDFITFHAKGGGYSADTRRKKEDPPSVKRLLQAIVTGHDIIARYPSYAGLECVVSECDPDGWAAGGAWDNVNLRFRNTEYYASYMACAFDKILKLGKAKQWNVKALSWAFMFVGERCFEGTRAFSTQGIDKAVLNLLRMLARLGDRQVALTSTGARETLSYPDPWGNDAGADIDGVASLAGAESLTVLLYSHHDNWDWEGSADVTLDVTRLPSAAVRYRVQHYRIDAAHSNAHAEWVRRGSPMYPTAEEYSAIKARDGLELLEPPAVASVRDGRLRLRFAMPIRSVSLLVITPAP